MRYLFLVILLAGLVFPWGFSTAHQYVCGQRLDVKNNLTKKFKEEVVVFGLTPQGALVQIWYNDKKGNWTITATHPNGLMTCIIANGSDFLSISPPKKGDPT